MSLNQMDHMKKMMQTQYSVPSQVPNLLGAQSSLYEKEPSTGTNSPFIQRERSFNSLTQLSLLKHHILDTSPVSHTHKPYIMNPHTMSPATLYLPSSTSSETHQNLENPHFLPQNPPSISLASSSESSLLLGDDVTDKYEKENSEDLMKEFFSNLEESSHQSSLDMDAKKGSLTLMELLKLRYLSEELGIPISMKGDNPNVDVSTI